MWAGAGAGAVPVQVLAPVLELVLVPVQIPQFLSPGDEPDRAIVAQRKCDQAGRYRGGIQVGYAADASSVAVVAARPDISERQVEYVLA